MSPENKLSPRQQEIIEISQDFADITRKWGKPIYGDENRLVFSPIFFDIKGDWVITGSADIRNPTIIINNGFTDVKHFNLSEDSDAIFDIPKRTRILTTETGVSVPLQMNSGVLVIEKNVDMDKMTQELELVDKKAIEIGLIINNSRVEILEKSYFVPQKRKIDEVFFQKGTTMAVPNGNFDEEINTFDHPEQLAIWINPVLGGEAMIIKIDHLNYLNKRSELMVKTLKKFNLDPSIVMEMSSKSIENNDTVTTRHIMAIMKIVHQEVNEELKKFKDLV
jgi:hypothetical protein